MVFPRLVVGLAALVALSLAAAHELKRVLENYSTGELAALSDDEIRERMSEWDEDGDGSINFAEFLSAMTRILTDTDNEERMKEAFQLFDKVCL